MKIKQEVLVVLSTMECTGRAAKITAGQLDRKLYLEANKVLEALGGKWNRAGKVHVFDGDAAELLNTAIVTGEVTTAREIGFFETPPELARKLCFIAGVRPGDHCLEPSAGTGSLVAAMVAADAGMVEAVEYDAGRRERLRQFSFNGAHLFVIPVADFMGMLSGPKFDRVVMNPPFTKVGVGDHLDHVQHAVAMLKPGGVLVSVLPVSVEFRQDRRHVAFRNWYTDLGGATMDLPDDSFKESGTGVRTCVLKIVKGA